jgi:hypothetical protein
MAISASGTISLSTILGQVEGLDIGVNKQSSVSKLLSQAWATGTAGNQLDRLFVDERSVAATAVDQLDFIGGGLTDVLGAAWAPARLKFLIIANLGPNDLQVVRPSNGIPIFLAVGDGEQIPTGGVLYKSWPSANGVTVVTGTGDLLNVINTAVGTSGYQIICGGASL